MKVKHKIESEAVHSAQQALVDAIWERHKNKPSLILAGIANGGLHLCDRLAVSLRERGLQVNVGAVNAMFHRDDIGHQPIPKNFHPTDLPFDIDDSTVVLVDDVLHSGRTVRAAMNELFDHGRPAAVELAVLCDRGGARLPIRANYVGMQVNPAELEAVRVELIEEDPQRDAIFILAI